MTLQELQHAFPSMPQPARRAVQSTLAALPDAPSKRGRARLALALAALLMLLSGIACAAMQPQILRWLLGSGEPSEALSALVQTADCSARVDGLTLRITGAVCDGTQVSLAYRIENGQPECPAAVLIASVCADGAPLTLSPVDAGSLLWSPDFRLDERPVQRNPAEGGVTAYARSPLEGPVNLTVEFAVLRPSGPLVFIDERLHEDLSLYDEAQRLDIQDQIDTVMRFDGVMVAGPQESEPAAWLVRGCTPIDLGGCVLGQGLSDAMKQTGAVTLRLSLQPGAAVDLTPEAPVALDDCNVVFDALILTPLSMRAELSLIPPQNTQSAASALAARYGALILCDPEGEPLRLLSMDYCSGGPGNVQQRNGRWVCSYSLDLPGPAAWPQALCLRAQGSPSSDPDLIAAFARRMIFPLPAAP